MATYSDILPAVDPPVNLPCVAFYATPALDDEPSFERGWWIGNAPSGYQQGRYAFGGPDPCMKRVVPVDPSAFPPADSSVAAVPRAAGTLLGMEPISTSSQTVKKASQSIGSSMPISGDLAIVYELTNRSAWNGAGVTGNWWQIAYTPRVWLRRINYSTTATRLQLEYYGADGVRRTPILTWTYGSTYGGAALPAPSANTPVRERISYKRSAGTLKWWVERPGYNSWHLIGTMTIAAADRDLWYGVESLNPGDNLEIGNNTAFGNVVRGFVIYDCSWDVGENLTYQTSNVATIDRGSDLGDWQPFEKWFVTHHDLPYAQHDNFYEDGTPVPGADAYNGKGHWYIPTSKMHQIAYPRPGVVPPHYGIGKITRQPFSYTQEPSEGIVEECWSSGKTLPAADGSTRVGATIWANWAAHENTCAGLVQVYGEGVVVSYNHNSNSELTGGGPSQWRSAATGGLGKLPTTGTRYCSHPNSHPQTVADGAKIHAELCATIVHKTRSLGVDIDAIVIGTELDTPDQFNSTNRDPDHFELWKETRAVMRHYCQVEMGDPDAIPIVYCGVESWSDGASTADTMMPIHFGYLSGAGLDTDLIDVHYNHGPSMFRRAYNIAKKLKAAAGLNTSNLSLMSKEDYTSRLWAWRTGGGQLQGRQADGSWDCRTCAEITHLGAVGAFIRHHHAIDASWLRAWSLGAGTFLTKYPWGNIGASFVGNLTNFGNHGGLAHCDRFHTDDLGRESPRYGLERLLCMTDGRRHTVTRRGFSGHSLIEAGTRYDGKLWAIGATTRLAPWFATGQDSLTLNVGSESAERTFGLWRLNSTYANYFRNRFAQEFDPAIDRVHRVGTVASDADGLATMTAIETAEVWFLLEDDELLPGTITAGGVTDASASILAGDAPSGGAPGDKTISWYQSTQEGVLGSLVAGATGYALDATGLTSETTYWFTRRVSDGYINADTDQVSLTTSAIVIDLRPAGPFSTPIFGSESIVR